MKKNNKGFSLIELIIAIAILVILTGLLAPQFMRYMEKSREAKDMQTLDTIYSAAQTALADEKAYDSVKVDIAKGTSGTALVKGGIALSVLLEDSTKDTAFAAEVRASLGSIDLSKVWTSKAVTETKGSEATFIRIDPTSLQVSVWIGKVGSGTNGAPTEDDILGAKLSGKTTTGTVFSIIK